MTELINKTWELLECTVKEMKKKDSKIHFENSAKEIYRKKFTDLYNYIKKEYMKNSVKNLDRHKVAAITIVCIIDSNAISYKGDIDDGGKFFGQYLAAASVGISYMQNMLNYLLTNKNEKNISRIWFPNAVSCDTPYLEIFSRNLYFSNEEADWKLNPLDIAEKLFLLEYITLEKNEINPLILADISH